MNLRNSVPAARRIRRRVLRAVATVAAIASVTATPGLGGCTVPRLKEDTAQTLEWLRLKDGTRITAATRWQLPRGARIRVEPLTPPPHPAWLEAAQTGINSVFPGAAYDAGPVDFRLLVSWPQDAEVAPGPEVSFWEIVDMDQFLPDFQGPMALRVALVRGTDDALVEAAELRVTPHWFAAEASAPRLVNDAFRQFAARFSPVY
ncbi:MAG: hypothetical protein RIE06_27650 [Roseibium album]|uniref:hypothetical protein n=1 Tax=Roseibium album TaxID=311410 RepID=UPI0032EBA0C1